MSPPQTFFKKRRWCFRLLLKKAFSKKVFVLQFHQAWNRGGLFVPLSQKSIKHLEAIRVVEAVLFRALIKYESFDGSFTFFRPFVTSFFGLQNLFSWHSCKIFMLHLYLQQTIFGLLWCYRILDRNKTDAPKLWRDSWKCKDRLLRTLQTIWLKIVKVNELREREGLYAKTTFTAINFWCSAFCFFFRRKQWWYTSEVVNKVLLPSYAFLASHSRHSRKPAASYNDTPKSLLYVKQCPILTFHTLKWL